MVVLRAGAFALGAAAGGCLVSPALPVLAFWTRRAVTFRPQVGHGSCAVALPLAASPSTDPPQAHVPCTFRPKVVTSVRYASTVT